MSDQGESRETSPGGQSPPWYFEGLRFECTGCGDCCRGQGYVWVDEGEIARLAGHLNLALESFGQRYLRRAKRRLALTEKPSGDCVFWDFHRGCTVYSARPGQCRDYPFWQKNLVRLGSWREVARECPGVGVGNLHSAEEIERSSSNARIGHGAG